MVPKKIMTNQVIFNIYIYILWFNIIHGITEREEDEGREGWVLARKSWQLIIRFKLVY